MNRGAYVLLWLALVFEVLSFGIGASWDRRWHATNPFEDFFSPPHLFIYTMHLCATLSLAAIAFSPARRRAFGPDRAVPPLPFPVPASLLFAGGGLGVVALAGALDGVWHTAFGLDETAWSTPHAMLGWGVLLTFLGLATARLALPRPVGWGSALIFGFCVLASSALIVTGPLGRNLTPEVVQAVSRLPVLAIEAEFQHTVRIELAWNLTRLNPLFVPLAAASAGFALSVLRAFDRRALVTLGLATLVSRTAFIPLLLPAALLTLARGRRVPPLAHLGTGLLYGIATAILWRGTPLGALLAAPFYLGGTMVGQRVGRVMRDPEPRAVLAVILPLGVGIPLLTGAVDLLLRSTTP